MNCTIFYLNKIMKNQSTEDNNIWASEKKEVKSWFNSEDVERQRQKEQYEKYSKKVKREVIDSFFNPNK